MNWNITQIKNDLKHTAKELQEMKRLFREPEQPRVTLALYRERSALRQRATVLCSIRAHHRNKIHLANQFETLDAQWEYIKIEVNPYELVKAAE